MKFEKFILFDKRIIFNCCKKLGQSAAYAIQAAAIWDEKYLLVGQGSEAWNTLRETLLYLLN